MADIIKVDIISDVVCPWCIIGYKRLEQAISEMGIQDRIQLEWRPFEINPDMPSEGEEIRLYGARKYGMAPDEGLRSRAHMTKLGAELEFTFDFFDGMKIVNTQDAHILLEFAREQGRQTELKMRLFEAFFSERRDVSDREILTQELHNVGLNLDEALARLEDDDARERVQLQEAHWRRQGVSGVPTVIFNHSSAVTGAQPVEVYRQIFSKLFE